MKEGDLTSRERRILRMMARGRSDKMIAADLRLSPRTVSNHVSHILLKLGARNRTDAVVKALRLGILQLDDIAESDSRAH
ncbi:MAG TPA: response regulator transcription factor [Dehalococcoidia bacterium]|nr:response regulator transcription factor [Dehalococcoidia bacterium]